MNNEQAKFCDDIYSSLRKYAYNYNIVCYSVPIAQAILESKWGKSELATKYNNYFGLKCGPYWVGKSVNLETKEEYYGALHTCYDDFRVFSNLDSGVKGYLNFINTKRYANLKGVRDPVSYVSLIIKDGYATSSKYVDSILNIIVTHNLTAYDVSSQNTNVDYLSLAKEVIGGAWGNGSDRITRLTTAGYDYNKVQSNVNYLLNRNNKKSNEEIAIEVIRGKWGNNPSRKNQLVNAGYDYNAIMKIVNSKL